MPAIHRVGLSDHRSAGRTHALFSGQGIDAWGGAGRRDSSPKMLWAGRGGDRVFRSQLSRHRQADCFLSVFRPLRIQGPGGEKSAGVERRRQPGSRGRQGVPDIRCRAGAGQQYLLPVPIHGCVRNSAGGTIGAEDPPKPALFWSCPCCGSSAGQCPAAGGEYRIAPPVAVPGHRGCGIQA